MSSKISFKDSPEVTVKTSRAQNAKIKKLEARIGQLESNVTVFMQSVESVQFKVNQADEERWMKNWGPEILSGNLLRGQG